MTTFWLESMKNQADETDWAQPMPVFSGQKLVVICGQTLSPVSMWDAPHTT